MAIQSADPKVTFIHIPKTGGTSVKRWMLDNVQGQTLKPKHGTKQNIESVYGDLGITFCIMRNPYDWLVSTYEFRKQGYNSFEDQLASDPKSKRASSFMKKKQNLEEYDAIKKGFPFWVKNYAPKKGQLAFGIKEIDIILQYDKLDLHFEKIQSLFNCYLPLEKHNVTKSRREYRDYYTPDLKKYVENIWYDDIHFLKFHY